MWFPALGVPVTLLGLAAQVPLQPPSVPSHNTAMSSTQPGFKFKEGADVFTPKDMLELARPGAGIANPAGDLILVPSSKYSFQEKKSNKSIFITSIESNIEPFEVSLTNGGEAFWLDARTVGHAVVEGDEDKSTSLYAISVKYDADIANGLSISENPELIGKFLTSTAANFRYSKKTGVLVFSDYVYSDGDLKTVKEHDKAWEDRGNSAYVFDDTYERHWDTWVGPKRSSLFSVDLLQSPDKSWKLGTEFVNLLQGTGHHCPVEPFGGLEDFDISDTHVVYTALDPKLPAAWHTKQDVHIVDIKGGSKTKELTSGKQGATHNPVFSPTSDKVAWIELDEDGYEADRAKIVIYDLTSDVRYTLTQNWDRSASALAFSPDGKAIYFTAGDLARVKVFVLPVPPTPATSTTDPSLPKDYQSPLSLTSNGAASGIQPLSNGRLLFSRSSVTGPNDVFVLRHLDALDLHSEKSKAEFKPQVEQLTRFTESALREKTLAEGEDFWFKGANGKQVHGWVIKPPGFKQSQKKKWPILMLIHGGPQSAWDDQWSTRWNYNVFANQGYFTIAMNPTGSSMFGQELTDAIAGDWGGAPFVDMQKGWKYILENYPQVDPDRAVAAGASWGGYAINWIQGHPSYGFGFKALVCHDGVFSAAYDGYSTDELFFFDHDWHGRPWDPKAKEVLAKFDPTQFVANWSTPQLIIHGSKDYRIPETDGIGAFHALQQLGVPSRLVIFPDENHWVMNAGNSLKWHYEVFRWFDKFVGEKVE